MLPCDEVDVVGADHLWYLVDYGWLSDSARPVTPASDDLYFHLSVDDWVTMEEIEHQGGAFGSNLGDIFSSADRTLRSTGRNTNTQDLPGDSSTSDPWADITNQVKMYVDSSTTKELEEHWSSTMA